MVRKELINSNLQWKIPIFLQIGFVVVFLLCMGTQTLYAQENITDTVVKVDLEKDTNYFFVIAEESPEFPGGDSARIQFLADNLRYPSTSATISGKVYVGFIIEEDGSLTNIKIVKGLHHAFDEEVIRVVKLMPNWIPAKQRGKAVRFQHYLSITFALEEDDSEYYESEKELLKTNKKLKKNKDFKKKRKRK